MRVLKWILCVSATILVVGFAIFGYSRLMRTLYPAEFYTILSPAGKAVHVDSPQPYLNLNLQFRPTNCSSCCQSLAGASIQLAVFGKTSLCDINLEFTEVDNSTVVTTSAYQNHAGLLNKFSVDLPNGWRTLLKTIITPETGVVVLPEVAKNEVLCSADASRDGNVYSLYFNTDLDDPECPIELLVLGHRSEFD